MTAKRTHIPSEGLSPAEAAAQWFARRDRGDLTPEELAAFEAWLSESPKNQAAYEAAEDTWATFDDVDTDAHIRALKQAALADEGEKRSWPWRSGVAVAASLVAIVLSVVTFTPFREEEPSPVPSGPVASLYEFGVPDYVTRKGERLNISLPDGTAVTLNTETELDIAYAEGRRFVRMNGGQAFFEVAKDPDRPFIVEANGKQIVALGTAFDVRIDRGELKVLLVEGKVSVEGTELNDVTATEKPEPVVMTAGEQLIVADGESVARPSEDIQRELRWRDGFVEFQNQTLGEAITEYNRYTDRPIVIQDPRVAQLRVTGLFRTDSADTFLETMNELLPVGIDRREEEVRIVWAGG